MENRIGFIPSPLGVQRSGREINNKWVFTQLTT
jgi:hypothetical protein